MEIYLEVLSMADNKQYVLQEREKGNVMISEDVIATIAAHAVSEVEGIAGLNVKPGAEFIEMLGKKFWGKVAYFFHGVKELLRVDDFNVKISDDNGVITKGKYIMMLIVNSRSVAGFKLNKNADLSDGGIDVILIKRKNKVLNYMSSLFAMASIFLFDIKNLKQSNNITRLTLDEFKIELSKKKIINVDGERGPVGNADFKVIKKGLKVIVPFKTIKKQSKIKLNDRIREQRELEKAVIKSREFDYREKLRKERERKLKEFQAKLKKEKKDK